LLVAIGVSASAQVPSTAASNPRAGNPQAVTQGAVLFRQECTYCHGVAARGGMRGPDLTTGSWSHGGTDADLSRTIASGVAGTAMPPNKLTEEEIGQIVAYLRTLQQAPAPASGDARNGEVLFNGPLRCASCHIVNGRRVVPHRQRARRPARTGTDHRRLLTLARLPCRIASRSR
jgi:cbb3-type cytochrome c oxidase subunit III